MSHCVYAENRTQLLSVEVLSTAETSLQTPNVEFLNLIIFSVLCFTPKAGQSGPHCQLPRYPSNLRLLCSALNPGSGVQCGSLEGQRKGLGTPYSEKLPKDWRCSLNRQERIQEEAKALPARSNRKVLGFAPGLGGLCRSAPFTPLRALPEGRSLRGNRQPVMC